jgi:hypothetical protein
MCEKCKSTLLGTIHRCPENSHLGMPIVHKWLRKRPCAFCKSCRGIRDLQLSYYPLGPFQLENLEKTRSKGASLIGFRPLASRARRRADVAHRPRRDPAGPARRGRLRSAGPCAVAAHAEPPSGPSPRAPRVHTHRAGHPTATSSYARRAAPALLLAVAPRHRLAVFIQWTAVTPSSRHTRL